MPQRDRLHTSLCMLQASVDLFCAWLKNDMVEAGTIFLLLFVQSVWGGKQSQAGIGRVCQTRAGAAVHRAVRERRWSACVFATHTHTHTCFSLVCIVRHTNLKMWTNNHLTVEWTKSYQAAPKHWVMKPSNTHVSETLRKCYRFISSIISPGEFVAQFKFTVLLMANGPLRITNSLFDPDLYKSEYKVEDPELKVKDLWSMQCFIHFLKLKYWCNGADLGALCWLCVPGDILPSYDILMSLFFPSSLMKNLLQSSASRKTQKKKKKKVSHRAVKLTGKNAEIVPLIDFSFFFFLFVGLKECRERHRTGNGDWSCWIDFPRQVIWWLKQQTSPVLLSQLSKASAAIAAVNTSDS